MERLSEQVRKVRRWLIDQPFDGILLSEQKNIAWLTGARAYVNLATERSIVFFLITESETVMYCSNIEKERLLAEEIGDTVGEIHVFPWYDPLLAESITQEQSKIGKVVLDREVESAFKAVRSALSPSQVADYRQLGKLSAAAVEETALGLQRGETELEIAGRLANAAIKRGIEPVVNLVAVDDRVSAYRHPLPTDKRLDRYVMIVLSGRRNGQYISLTRLVHFGVIPIDLKKKHAAVCTIDSRLMHHTRVGQSMGDLFKEMKAAYAAVGYQHEWKNHHQGGLTGYVGRERLLQPDAQELIQANEVYAWNPSITGTKSEDTILVTESGPEILTLGKEYPLITVTVAGCTYERPDILVRNDGGSVKTS
ncbi:M24 family metallopeptidase, partial [Halalkalibacterium halodurans]|uniref:M24 family metallopeptidase n=2 Tax=Halalkalibacterium halodurans TaxID=86665 RepID=UPI002E1FED42|nr:M24 family metallopeptidase [Halalkalibacterium halodurans]